MNGKVKATTMPLPRPPALDGAAASSEGPPCRPRVIVVGAGFGGLSAVKALAHAPVEITVIDRRNHHLFQPLLYQVATAALAPTQIASPIRTVLRTQVNARVLLAEVTGIDLAAREVLVGKGRAAFDYLIVATGAAHAYFGHEEWAAHAPGLKSLEDAIGLRSRVLTAFEAAEIASQGAERERLLTFVVIGAGPTGVELAGAIAELALRALATDFRALRSSMARVVLVEAGPRVLPTFRPRASAWARKSLEKLGVEVKLGTPVTGCDSTGVRLGDQRLEAANVIWAAGVRASAAGAWLGGAGDPAGRVRVQPDLSLPGAANVFVIGDLARVVDAAGRLVPGVAPAAKQQGQYVGRLIGREVGGRPRPGAFRYRDFGALATIGRNSAVVELGPIEMTGFLAWLFWGLAHIYFLVGFRNRLQVALDWVWSWLTFERGARLITGEAAGTAMTSQTEEVRAYPTL